MNGGTHFPQRSLQAIDRAADARARMYAAELRAMIATARACGSWSVPLSALEIIADRMDDTHASDSPAPTSLDAWRNR